MAEDPAFPLSREEAVRRALPLLASPPRAATVRSSFVLPLVTGLPASPGTASGPIVTDPEAALAAADAGTPAILVRAETSPDDVHGMARAAGILTSRGGLASHAAVVARGWGIPAVVGAVALDVRDGEVVVGDRMLSGGAVITIDGSSGEVFEGRIPGTSEVVPEARIMIDWARELGIPLGPEGPSEAAPSASATRKVSPDEVLRAIAIKGFVPLPGLADAVLSSPDDVRAIVDQLAIDGLVATSAGAYKLTDTGTTRSTALLEAERFAWGIEAAASALEAFLDLDHRMKDIVTAWQVRDTAAQVLNDHADAGYDRSVLDRLAALHDDSMGWIAPLRTHAPRLAVYADRLGRALEQAQAGDQLYVASPRVDSYHSIWFELHEDLIQLAGRTRAAEAAAGRA
jgi:pyruvate,orthophosphate dikinase